MHASSLINGISNSVRVWGQVMTQQDRNALKKLKRKYPELSRVGNNNKQEDRRRQKIMMSTEDYELYLKLTNQKGGNDE
jgi:hypothetical protein